MKKVEFFIVGNGLAGTLLAFEMLEQNIAFRIITSPVKKRASLAAAGIVNPLVFKRLTKSWLVGDLLPVMNSTYKKLGEILGEQLYFENEILKPLSGPEKDLWLERKKEPAFSAYISAVEDKPEIKFLKGSAGFGKVTGSGYLDISRFLSLTDSFFKSKGLAVESGFDYKNINPLNEYISFEGLRADRIVFCEGHFIRQNPFFLKVKLIPAKGELLLISAPELDEGFILNKGVFVLPVGNHRFKVGSTYEWEDLTENPTEAGKASILERLHALTSADFIIENHWAGIRPTVSDRRPVLGVHPEFKQLSVFNGLGTKGVMLCPYFAKEMVRLLVTPGHEINAEVRLDRFL